MSGTAEFFGLKVPFLKHLGVKAEMAEGGRSRISLELRPEMLNSFDVSHGGVIMTMLDVAMAVAARTSHEHVGGVMTIDMSVSFIRSAKGRIVAEGRLLRGGNSLHFCEGEAFDESGELVAKSLGTFKLRRLASANSAEG
jgi:uncharacterized protein (TIGR00369 family)